MNLEFAAADTERGVAESGAIKQTAKVVAEPTLGYLDRRTVRLTRHVHGISHYTHLQRDAKSM